MKKPFFEDIMQPLDKVERKWVRRPVVLFYTPIFIIFGAIFGLVSGAITWSTYWIKKCW